MDRYRKIVLEAPEGMHVEVTTGETGELIIQLVSDSPTTSQGSTTCSERTVTEKTTSEDKFFTKITVEDRKKVKNWLTKQKGKTDREKSFLKRVREAVKAVNYDYWIANLEPSVTDRKIYYAEGNAVGVGFSCNQWWQMAKEYAPERGSRLSNEFELYIWYALRIMNSLWTLDYVANDSSSAGNYWNAPGATHSMEKTGARTCGGYRDGQGNSYKIVTRESGYALVGGICNFNGDDYPVADVIYHNDPYDVRFGSSGVLVLTK